MHAQTIVERLQCCAVWDDGGGNRFKERRKKKGDRVVSCGHSQLEDGNDDHEVKRIYIYIYMSVVYATI